MERTAQTTTQPREKIPTALNKLRVGDVFWDKVTIDSEDVADPRSDTAKDVRNRRKTKRLLVVLNNCPVQAVYLATFDKSRKLPRKLRDTSLWYPVNDAAPEHENHYCPLETEPRLPGAQWVNVRKPHLVISEKVERIGGFRFPEVAVAQLIAALKTRTPSPP